MPFTQRLMATGDWSVDLDPDTPQSVLDKFTFFGHIIITPVEIPVGAMDATALHSIATYTGVYPARSNTRTSLSGYGLAYWLGAASGLTDVYESKETPGTLSFYTWLTTKVLRNSKVTNGITEGTIENPGSNFSGEIEAGSTPLDVLNDIARDRANREWRINHDGSLDADTEANMFVSVPTVVLSPHLGGRSGLGLTGFHAAVKVEDDVEDFTTRVAVKPTAGSNGAANIATNPYFGLDGLAVERTRYIESQAADTQGEANTIAAQQLGRFDDTRRNISVTVDAYDLAADVNAGDTVYVYAPDSDIYDVANGVHYQGHFITPAAHRVTSTTQPIRKGMGVWFRQSDSAGTLVDVTPYVAWESGPATVQVGAKPRKVGLMTVGQG